MLGLASDREEEQCDPLYDEDTPKAEAEYGYVPVKKRAHAGTGRTSRRPQHDDHAQVKPPSQGH